MDNTRQPSRLRRTASVFVLSMLTWAANPLSIDAAPSFPETVPSTDGVGSDSDSDAARFVAISPTRVHDSREGDHTPAPHVVFPVTPLSADVLEAADVDPGAVTAVVINVTVLNASGPGYVTVSPHGAERPSTSTVNYVSPTQINANLAMSRVGDDRRLDVFTLTAVDVVIDVQGVFVRAETARSGRHVPIRPQRVLDTRDDDALEAHEPRLVDVSQFGVPIDATAALVTLVAVDTSGPGYFTAWPANHVRPTASNLNFSTAGLTVSNAAIVSIHEGKFMLVSSADGDAVVDISGYVTGDGAEMGRRGLFVATEPHRLVDTRDGPMIPARSTTPFTLTGEGPIPSDGVGSVSLNITATSMNRAGFLAALASGRRYEHTTSTVNVAAGVGTAASAAVVRIGAAGSGIGLYTSADTHVVIDVSGYFLGEPDPDTDADALFPTVPPVPPTDDDFALLHSDDGLPAGFQGHIERDGRTYVGWHPCRPIRYVVHDRLATPLALDVLQEAVDAAATATGFEFVPVGRAADLISPEPRDLATFSQRIDAELLIGFSTPAETPALSGTTKGFGGIGWHAEPYRVEGQTVYHRAGGLVAVDIAELTDPVQLKAVLLHELAHFLGLDHVSHGAGEVMVGAVGTSPRTSYGNGDLNGLRLLGTAGCVPRAALRPVDG